MLFFRLHIKKHFTSYTWHYSPEVDDDNSHGFCQLLISLPLHKTYPVLFSATCTHKNSPKLHKLTSWLFKVIKWCCALYRTLETKKSQYLMTASAQKYHRCEIMYLNSFHKVHLGVYMLAAWAPGRPGCCYTPGQIHQVPKIIIYCVNYFKNWLWSSPH